MTIVAASAQPRIVLYIDSLKAGGAERATLTLARWLQEGGWQPVVLTRRPCSDDFYPVPEGLERAVEDSDSRFLRVLGVFGFPLRVLRLQRWLVKQRISLAIGMTTLPSIKLLLACCQICLPCVVSERNYPPAKPTGLVWGLLRRLTYPWADLHIVQTRLTGVWLSKHLRVGPQLLLPNPVLWPLQSFEPILNPEAWLKGRGIPPDAQIILAVGTKVVQKGFDRLVKIFGALAHGHPRLHLLIIGVNEVPYKGINQQQCLMQILDGDRESASRVHFPGKVGNMADWYSVADLFVLPSRYEGFPNVLLEAMSAGCACVASDCLTGPSDVISHNVNGVLLAAGATDADWVACLDALLKDESTRNRLAENASQVRDRYGELRVKTTFLDALSSLPVRRV